MRRNQEEQAGNNGKTDGREQLKAFKTSTTANSSSILKLCLAIALLFLVAQAVVAVTVEVNTNDLVVNSGGDVNLDSGTFFVDSINHRVGIGTQTPTFKLDFLNPASGTVGNAQLMGAGSNLVRDGSFELWGTPYAGLTAGGAWGGDTCTRTTVSGDAPHGNTVLQISQTHSTGGCNSWRSEYMPVQPNQVYTYSFWGRLISGSYGNINNMYVREYDANYAQLKEEGKFYGTLTSSWQHFSYTFTTLANTRYILADHYNYVTGTAQFDGVSIQKGSVSTEYSDSTGDIMPNAVAYGNMRVNGTLTANGDLCLSSGSCLGSVLNSVSPAGMKGRLVNYNPDFSQGLFDYGIYDNTGSGKITHSIVVDATSPSTSGRILRVRYDGTGTPSSNPPGPTPGYGGFFINVNRCANIGEGATAGDCYIDGNRYMIRIWAKIPAGRSIYFHSNAYGTDGTFNWVSSQAGTGNWAEYVGSQKIGTTGTLSTTGFWAIDGGPNTAFSWDVASVEMIGIDEPASVDVTKSLNIGYKKDVNLGNGNLLSTGNTYLATDTGNVGIGTTTPTAKLHVAGGGILVATGGDVCLQSGVCLGALVAGGGGSSSGWTNSTTTIYTNDINDVVGIGTTSPSGKLEVSGGDAFFSTAGYGTLRLAPWSSDTFYFELYNAAKTGSGTKLYFTGFTGAQNTMTVDIANQRVGIVQQSPSYTLDVSGTAHTTGAVTIGGTTSEGALTVEGNTFIRSGGILYLRPSANDYDWNIQATGYTLRFGSASFTNPVNMIMTIDGGVSLATAGGNVGIGTASPSDKLDIFESNQHFTVLTNKRLAGSWPATAEATTMTIQSSGSSAGNLAFATGNSEIMRITAGGNVGIGTTSPAQKLDVAGTIRGTDVCTSGGICLSSVGAGAGSSNGGGWKNTTTVVSLNTASNSVGIGTATPASKLHVSGGDIRLDDNTQYALLKRADSPYAIVRSSRTDGTWQGNLSANGWGGYTFTGGVGIGGYDPGTAANLLVNGNVGIGTTNPSEAKLQIASAGAATPNLRLGTAASGSLSFINYQAGHTYNEIISGINEHLVLSTSGTGNVGIGTTNPTEKLHVAGDINVTAGNDICITGGKCLSQALTAAASGPWSETTPNVYLATLTNNVGIGTATPTYKLTVQTATSNYGLIHTDGTVRVGTYVGGSMGWIGTQTAHPLAFFTNNGGAQMTLTTAGNVGIGVSPAYRLDVTGGAIRVQDTANIIGNTVAGIALGRGDGTNGAGLQYGLAAGDALIQVGNRDANGGGPRLLLGVRDATTGDKAAYVIAPDADVPIIFGVKNAGGSPVQNAIVINSSGNVGIGTPTPATRLDVAGTVSATGFRANGETGITNGFWVCQNDPSMMGDCPIGGWCRLEIQNGIITGCV